MHETVEDLLNYCKEDQEVFKKNKILGRLPDKTQMLRKNLDELLEKYEALKRENEERDKRIKEREILLDIEKKRISEMESRMMKSEVQQEYYLIKKDIEHWSKKCTEMENQILEYEEAKEKQKEKFELALNEVNEAKKEFELKNETIISEQTKIEAIISKAEKQASTYRKKINNDLLQAYDLLCSGGMRPAVVEISSASCTGCSMKLPAQKFNLIIRDSYGACPHCNRIMVYQPPPQEEEKPA